MTASKSMPLVCILVMASALTAPVAAGTVSPIQSTASPYGLEPVGPVQVTGSDDQASDFNNTDLDPIREIVNSNLSERIEVDGIEALALNPDSLVLEYPSEVRVYFVHEGAGYANTLGVYTGDSSDALSGDAALIFPNASSYNRTSGWISNRTPLLVGDFVDLGNLDAGTQLNFFVVSNGANGGTSVFYTDTDLNYDGLDHFVALATEETDSLIIGAEDLPGGGDKDYNDVVIAIQIGKDNVQSLTSKAAPLPAPILALAGALLPLVRRRIFGAPPVKAK